MDKFNPSYSLSVETIQGTTLLIEPPFTLQLDVTRNVLSSANVSVFKILNLSATNRNKIRKNRWDYGDIRKISVRAGYGDNLPVIFSGDVSRCFSVRDGNNMVTQIECFDAGFAFANATVSQQFPAGTDQRTVIQTILQSLPDVSVGSVGNYSGQISRGNSYSGAATDILREISGGGFFIDNGKAHVLKDDEVLPGAIQVINSASGLLGTPVVEETYINFEMLFEPRLVIGQAVKIESITAENFNGTYKVVSLRHSGIISEAVGGDLITSVGLFAPGFLTLVS